MNIGFIIAGIVFLFIPNVNIIDFMPDFIGYALIMKGISRVRLANLSFDESYINFRRLMLVQLCKIPAMGVYGLINVSGIITFDANGVVNQSGKATDYTSLLLVCILFAAVEIILTLKAFSSLFDGIRESAYCNGQYAANTDYSNIRMLTLFFAVAKPVMYVLPELSSLSTGNYGVVTESGVVALVKYRNVFTVISFVVCLALGIYWLVKITGYLRRIKKDGEYLQAVLARALENEELNPMAKSAREVMFPLVLLAAALLFTVEIRIDGLDVIPPFIAGGLFIALFFMIKTESKSGRIYARALSIAYTVSALCFSLYSYFMSKDYSTDDLSGFGEILATEMEFSFEAMDRYFVWCAVSALSSVLLALLLIEAYRLLKREKERFVIIPELSENVLRMDVDEATLISARLNKRLKATLVLGIISAVSSFVMTLLTPYFPTYWMLDFVIRALFILLGIYCTLTIRSSARSYGRRISLV